MEVSSETSDIQQYILDNLQMYCEIVYFIEENNSLKRRVDLKLRGVQLILE